MFERLVESSQQRRKHTAAKYFFGTSVLYVCAIACAFAISVLMSDPKLADTDNVIAHLVPVPPPTVGKPPRGERRQQATQASSRLDLNNVQSLDHILSRRNSGPPPLVQSLGRGLGGELFSGNSDDPIGSKLGVPDGNSIVEAPPRPVDPPKPKPAPQTVIDRTPMRVTSSVLQGKAIERRKPAYPPLAQRIRLQDQVSVEVVIAPGGHVESARVVSGHPMFHSCVREAALGWRFQPTLLNKMPVRVTGVIVFVFKLSE